MAAGCSALLDAFTFHDLEFWNTRSANVQSYYALSRPRAAGSRRSTNDATPADIGDDMISTHPKDVEQMSTAPIAGRLIARMKRKTRGKLVNIKDVVAGRTATEKLQNTVVTEERLKEFSSGTRAYVTRRTRYR